MKERLLIVQKDRARAVVDVLVAMGLQVCVAGHLPRTDLVLGDEIHAGAVEPKVLLQVRGDVPRKKLKAIPGVVRVRSKTLPKRGPVIARV